MVNKNDSISSEGSSISKMRYNMHPFNINVTLHWPYIFVIKFLIYCILKCNFWEIKTFNLTFHKNLWLNWGLFYKNVLIKVISSFKMSLKLGKMIPKVWYQCSDKKCLPISFKNLNDQFFQNEFKNRSKWYQNFVLWQF